MPSCKRNSEGSNSGAGAGAGSSTRPASPGQQESLDPVVLVPGVCGTQLAVRRKGCQDDGQRCWVTLRSADASFQKVWGKYSKESGLVEPLDSSLEVCVPVGPSDDGLYAVSVLDPDVGFAVQAVHYFEPVIDFLQSHGYSPGESLFGAGYDFRQSCRVSARALLARLHAISHTCGGRQVNLITHSLGGLVVRSLLADHPEDFKVLVRKWVAIGCPFGGAPGYAVDGLVTGVQFGGSLGDYFFVQRGTFRQAACQSPAVYEMLPPLEFPFSQPPPKVTLWLKTPIPDEQLAGQGGLPASHCAYRVQDAEVPAAPSLQPGFQHSLLQLPRSPLAIAASSCNTNSSANSSTDSNWAHSYVFQHDAMPSLLTRLLKDNSVSVQGSAVPLPFDPEVWALAQATHKSWQDARMPSSCAFYNVVGTGLSTPYDVQYGVWYYPAQDLEAVPHTAASFSYVPGDGTVPEESARSHGFHETASVTAKGAHRDLIAMQEVWDTMLGWLQEPQQDNNRRNITSTFDKPCVPRAAEADDEELFWNPLVWMRLLA